MNGGNASLSSVYERFLAFERDADLFSREACGVRFWHYIRFFVYSSLVLPHFVPMDAPHPDLHLKNPGAGGILARVRERIRSARELFRFLVMRNPAFAIKRRNVMLALAPRTTRCADGRTIRLAIDFFAGKLKSSWCVLEEPNSGSGYAVHDGGGRIFCWEPVQRAVRRYKASPNFRDAIPEVAVAARRLADEISAWFGVSVEAVAVEKRVRSALALERAAVPLLRGWLRRLGVKCVVEVVHYGSANMALTRAAHAEGLPVVELQHGTVYHAHAAYNLPVKAPDCTPDHLLGWGEYWLGQTSNFPLKSSVAMGYPYLESFLAAMPRRPSAHGVVRVLFISQGTVGRELADCAVKLSKALPPERFKVSFKLHPNESKSWRGLYPALLGSGVDVIENTARNIYSCFAESDVTVGVYSTALLEGLMWGLRTYVLAYLPGADTMKVFAAPGMFSFVDSVDGLAASLTSSLDGGTGETMTPERLFMGGNAAARIAEFIDKTASQERTP